MNQHRFGLAVLGLVSLGDIATLPLTDGEHPPMVIAVLSAVLGLASLPLIARSWRDRSAPVRGLSWIRVISAATALPAFVVGGVPAEAVIGAAVVVALTAVGVALVLAGREGVVQSLA